MHDSPGEIFARRLRETRQAADITQAGLASRLSAAMGTPVADTMITKIEGGSRSVSIDEAMHMAEILDAPLSTLVSELDPVEARLKELHQQLKYQQVRTDEAEAELRQAMTATAHIQKEIEQLEAAARRS